MAKFVLYPSASHFKSDRGINGLILEAPNEIAAKSLAYDYFRENGLSGENLVQFWSVVNLGDIVQPVEFIGTVGWPFMPRPGE